MMPRFKPTEEQRKLVKSLVGYGVKHEDICQLISSPRNGKPIDDKTLRRHFRAEIDTGQITANTLVAESLFKKAVGTGPSSITAAIFWLKCRAGWKETQVVEHTGKDGGPIEQVSKADLEEAFNNVREKF